MGVLLALQIKNYKPEFAVLIGIGIGMLLLLRSFRYLQVCYEQITRLRELAGDQAGYLKILLKLAGVTYGCEFCAGICRDAGYGEVAKQLQILNKLTILVAGIPIVLAVIESIYSVAD